MDEKPLSIRVTGIVWYRPEDYDAILRIMADRHVLPVDFHIWLMQAETGEKKLRRNGHTVVRAYIDPETFPEWCRRHDLNIDAEARMTFANSIAEEHARNTH